jgi:uncharacterized protein DUF4232
VTKAHVSVLALAFVLAGCERGGAHEAGPVPTGSAPVVGTSTKASTEEIALCANQTTAIAVGSEQGAAGTISRVWRVTNNSQSSCRSFGYPGMDFHTSSGWLNTQVRRGGFQNIDQQPTTVVLSPGQSLFFVSYWNHVDTDAGPCKEFDRVKVTLPDNFVSAELTSSGCLNPQSVAVGPVTATPPS